METTILGKTTQEKFDIAPLGHNQVILGRSWLFREQPTIDWEERRLYPKKELATLATNGDLEEPAIPKELEEFRDMFTEK